MRKGELIINVLPVFLVLFGLTVTIIISHSQAFGVGGFLMTLIGFVVFVAAKLPGLKEGNFFSFGPASMTEADQKKYKTGYTLMGLGSLLSLFCAFAG